MRREVPEGRAPLRGLTQPSSPADSKDLSEPNSAQARFVMSKIRDVSDLKSDPALLDEIEKYRREEQLQKEKAALSAAMDQQRKQFIPATPK